MLIVNAQDKNKWNEFIEKLALSPFTQKLGMGRRCRKSWDEKIWRLELRENDELIGAAQII